MFSGKRIFIFVLLIFLLVAIPLVVYLVSVQLKSSVTAVPSTTLSISPDTQSAKVGEDVNFNVQVTPKDNSVSFVKLTILYDPTKLATEGAGFVTNSSSFPLVVEGPTFDNGTINVTVSVNANSPAITSQAQVGTLTFKTLEKTDTAPTQLTFGTQSQVLANGQSNAGGGNLLATTIPANLNINSDIIPTPTPLPLAATSPTPTTVLSSDSNLTPTVTPITSTSPTPTPTSTPVSLADPTYAATVPICTGFTADRPTSGTAPFNVNFTLVGTSSANIDKATFVFGDGQTQDITAASGAITGNTVNALVMHVYTDSGTFNAYGTITDIDGNVSQVTTQCSQITVYIKTASGSAVTTVPSLAPSGPSNFISIGILGILIAAVGVVLLIAL